MPLHFLHNVAKNAEKVKFTIDEKGISLLSVYRPVLLGAIMSLGTAMHGPVRK